MRSSLITATAGAYALLGGALSFLGWVTGAVRLRDWFDVGIGIKTNTALALCIAGAGLLLTLPAARMPAARYAVRALGVLVAAIGGLTLLQHLVHVDLGIDTLIFTEPPGAPATTSPNRMGLPASACLLAFGVGLWLQTGAVMARRAAVILGLAVLAISSLSLVGYWFGAQDMYSAARVTAISLQTATMLAALAIGLIAACPRPAPDAHAGRRRAIERAGPPSAAVRVAGAARHGLDRQQRTAAGLLRRGIRLGAAAASCRCSCWARSCGGACACSGAARSSSSVPKRSAAWRKRPCAKPMVARIASSQRSRTSCATRSRPSRTRRRS